MKRYRYSAILAAIALCALSCTSEPLYEIGGTRSDALSFSVSTASWGDSLSVVTANVQSSLQEDFPVAALCGDELQLLRSLEGNAPETRAVAKESLSDADGQFSVVCYVNTNIQNGASFDKNNCHLYFPVRNVSYDSGSRWLAAGGEKDLWMPASNLRFCAWWPQTALGSAPHTLAYDQDTKKLSFTLDKPYAGEVALTATHYAAEEQRDLLVSVTDSGNDISADQPLSFRHALTAVQFCTTNNVPLMQGTTIKRITIKNVPYKGTLDLMAAATNLGQAWSIDVSGEADLADFTVRPSEPNPGTGTVLLNGGEKTFFMLPQSLDAEINGRPKEVEIEFQSSTETMVFSASLTGLPAWEPGQTVKYLLGQRSGDAYIIFADAITVGPTATSSTMKIHSYRVNAGGTVKKWVPFRTTGVSIDGGRTWNDIDATEWTGRNQNPTTPWMTNLNNIRSNNTGDYNDSPNHIALTITPNVFTGTESRMDEIDAMMQAEPEVTDRDLSLYDANGNLIPGGRCTANCYVVSGAGSYKFPAVYGNAILNGVEQLDQCSLSTFRNFNLDGEDAPSNAWINQDIYHQQAGTVTRTIQPVRAVVIWQQSCYYVEDRPEHLVWVTNTQLIDPASLTYDNTSGMIGFTTCPASDMHQGNALIALLDADDTVLWSWHIWFTSIMRYLEGSTPSAPIPYTDIDIDPDHNGLLWARENLGTTYWGMIHSYSNRGAMLRLQQTDESGNILSEGSTAKVQVNQTAGKGKDFRIMMNPFYQCCNKNPYPTYTPQWGDSNQSYYSSSPTTQKYSWFINEQLNGMDGVITNVLKVRETRPLQETIRRPWVMFYSYNKTYNLWSLASEPYSTAPWTAYYDTQKTIYDPNPYPYSVPANYRLLKNAGLELTAKSGDGVRLTNTTSGEQLYFPFTGWVYNYLSGSTPAMNNPANMGSRTGVWTSLTYYSSWASAFYTMYRRMFFDEGSYWQMTANDACMFPVRPSRVKPATP